MTCIITYPVEDGFYVLATSAHPAVTQDAAWRRERDVESAKEFPSEIEAKSYIVKNFPQIPIARFSLIHPT